MLINGIELSSLGVQLYDRVLYSNNVDTSQDWLDGDIQPTFIRQQDRFKNIKLDFLVLSADEDEAFLRISKLTAMLKKATIQFDDLSFSFDVNMVNAMEPTRLKNGNFIVSYNLTSGYAKGQREIYTTNANMTNAFNLTVAYYQNTNTLIATDTITIRASAFNDGTPTLDELGINANKYQPEHYNNGVATNLQGIDLTYENLQNLQALIINYAPIVYNLSISYFMDNGSGVYNELLNRTQTFTYPELQTFQTIGQLVKVAEYRPQGYKSSVQYNGELTVEDLLIASPIAVYYDKVESAMSKTVIVSYKKEDDEGGYETLTSQIVVVDETQFYDGLTLQDIINIQGYHPSTSYYNAGYIEGHKATELVDYYNIETNYTVIYPKAINTIFVEYYAGTYPNWYRLTSLNIQTTYKVGYDTAFDVIKDLNIDLNKYHTNPYNDGALYNASTYMTYDDVINAGVLQIYYTPIEYPIIVSYYTQGLSTEPVSETIYINDLMFFGEPILSDIIPILAHRPEGYQFSENFSYNGEITLSALTQASPIQIVYEEIEVMRSKNIILRYKKELSSLYSTITTNLITINEADIIGGVRLKDIFNLNAYQPDYYDSGIIDGTSSTALLSYDQIGSSYDILYVASTYNTPVRYYVDEISDLKWIGSSNISYRVIDFEAGTTLFDFGLNLNMFKPAYTGDGILQYTGPVNFTSLLEATSIDVLYVSETPPPEEDEIDYPHRFLFLQHNDLGSYEHLHPEWTMNHAYINTGISAEDMSKLTVIMECGRADENVPLYQVNAGYGYLFGSYSALGAFFMRYNNQTMYGEGLTGVNTYEAKAGAKSDVLVLTEDSAIGFSENTGIYSSPQDGYSRAVFTYTNTLATDGAQMPYPLYLFANNYNGSYSQGLAGIGIYGCRIYYDNQLIRDFIPVQYYDKIGDQVAPSNCLYDKITHTFFEDETGLNSFNIRDDERYTDTNLQHKIGHCYINYYKGDEFIKTVAIYFRGDEFGGDPKFDLYDKFLVDENQPQYCKSGEIQNIKDIVISFTGLNNGVFNVYYEPISTQIEVNYYRENAYGERTLLQTERIALEEKDFYQAPTFGDLVRLNKYKPEGYKTDFVYPGSKVSLSRVVENSPYNIIYTPITEPVVEYSTTIRFIKKVYGVRQYETIGTQRIVLDQSDFRDGEYIDFHINLNGMKPEKYYLDGETYQWYAMDERLTNPEDLKPTYTVVYMPETQYLDINYYTDEVDELNLIASATWGIAIDELEPGYTYSVAEILPNDYINKFKPIICNGGMVQGADVAHTFESLVELGHIDILYETIIEPDDPTNAVYDAKVLGFGVFDKIAPLGGDTANPSNTEALGGGTIPWIDLGYRPKELGRLKVECKAVSESNGFLSTSVCPGGFQDTAYSNFFGYCVPKDVKKLGDYLNTYDPSGEEVDIGGLYSTKLEGIYKGHFTIGTHIPTATSWTFASEGPQYIDGQVLYKAGDGVGVIAGQPKMLYYGDPSSFRRGAKSVYDENWEVVDCYNEYGIKETREINYDGWIVNPERCSWSDYAPLANPITTILDAYNGYATTYNEDDSNNSPYIEFENNDKDIFEARLQPKGSLTLFRTRNPLTGEMNIMAHNVSTRPSTTVGVPMGLQGSSNPYTDSKKVMTYEILVAKARDEDTGLITYELKTVERNVVYADFKVPVHPQLEGCAIWGLKIWDRDRLVRDLIPVAKGDKIYDYIMPENGMFDLITEIFFGNSNQGGKYELTTYFDNKNINSENDPQLSLATQTITVEPEEVMPLWVILDPSIYGKITINYYDYDYSFINNQFVNVPTWFSRNNTTAEDILQFNDYKPSDFHLDGILDIDSEDNPLDPMTLYELYKMGSANIWYKLRTFTKTVVYYRSNYRVGSKDIFYSLQDIENATSLADLNIDVDLYYDSNFAHGEIRFDESILAEHDIKAFIDAPSPIVVYEKLSKEEAPDVFYVEYYRGGASDDTLITIDPDNPNYLDCQLDGVILNPNGAIKYYNHYHSALYEDEKFDYFIPYQVRVLNKYTAIHRGPARKFPVLGNIVVKDTYTITEERNGWGRLKEYPVGWIMLSHTEPMTGPGQNPEYDVPNEETATIPFKTEISINKMTVDRLWCYAPEVESWVKAEDISYNQSGRMYNSLDVRVIDLSAIDFSTVGSLTDMGIYPDAKALYFHDRADSTYEGEYSYEAFSQLHEIDFIYPETIYNYTCIYYKDVIDAYTRGIGITKGEDVYRRLYKEPTKNSDWNTAEKGKYFYILSNVITNDEGNWYQVASYAGSTSISSTEGIYYLLEEGLEVINLPIEPMKGEELGRASFSCCISDWNPDWDVFVATSWRVDEEGNDISPDLYRDTELLLNWDYFGFDRNLYRPLGYPDGIYLWDARTWDDDHTFTFEELVKTGTQYVLYPTQAPNYKMLSSEVSYKLNNNDLFGNYDDTWTPMMTWGNNNYTLDLNPLPSQNIYDIYAKLEIIPYSRAYSSITFGTNSQDYDYSIRLGSATSGNIEPSNISVKMEANWFYSTDGLQYKNNDSGAFLDVAFGTWSDWEKNDYFIYNISNYRKSPSIVVGRGNEVLNKPPIFYTKNVNDKKDYDTREDYIIINDETINLTNASILNHKYNYPTKESGGKQYSMLLGSEIDNVSFGTRGMAFYELKGWKGSMMSYYWVPVPKGYRYNIGPYKRQAYTNGLLNLLDGHFKEMPDINIYLTTDGDMTQSHDYFYNWTFDEIDANYIVKTNGGVNTYTYPDALALDVRTLPAGLVMPISKATSDATNHVIGEWYFSGDQWFQSNKVGIYAGLTPARLTKLQQDICLVQPTDTKTNIYYVYLDPEAVSVIGENSDTTYSNMGSVITAYYNYVNSNGEKFYFDGNRWVPEDYTAFNTTEWNRNYAVVPESLTYYAYPVIDDTYKLGSYHYGERITVPYISTQNPNWGYTGLGWIQLTAGNVSEVIS